MDYFDDITTEEFIEDWPEDWPSPFQDHPGPDEDDEEEYEKDTPYWISYDEPILRFAFRASWMEAIDKLSSEDGDALLYAIMEYAFEGSYTSTYSKVDSLMQHIMYEITRQKDRFLTARYNGSLGGRPLNKSGLRIFCLSNPDLSPKGIASRFGVSLRTVQRCLRQIVEDYTFVKQSFRFKDDIPGFAQLEKALKENLAFKHYRRTWLK